MHSRYYRAEEYGAMVRGVIRDGDPVVARQGRCFERLDLSLEFTPGALIRRPGVNYALGYAELLQLIAGTFDPAALVRVAPRADHSLFTPQMAYGPRVISQVYPVLTALRDDPLTRQAVLFVGGAEDGPTSNQPCTSTIQFLHRGDFLHTLVTMRSWDLVKGLTYDVMMFGGLAMFAALALGLVAGPAVVRAGSAHVYESDLHRVPPPGGPELPQWWFTPDYDLRRALGGKDNPAWSFTLARDWAQDRLADPAWTKGPPAGIVERRPE